MTGQPKTGWIQKLKKHEIIELEKRKVTFDRNDINDNLREQLREAIKTGDVTDPLRNSGETSDVATKTEEANEAIDEKVNTREQLNSDDDDDVNEDIMDKFKFQMDDDWEIFE